VSSPLDGRIRAIAREEALAALGDAPAGDGAGADRVATLEQEVTSLHDTMLRLEQRLIAALEKATGQTNQEAVPAARRTRKAAGE